MILPYRKFFVLLHSQLEINRYIQSLIGKMAEWSIATVLKTVEGNTSGGSNPSLSANNIFKSAASQRLTADLILYTYKNTYKLKGNPSPIQMRQYHGKSKEGKIILRVFIEDNKVS